MTSFNLAQLTDNQPFCAGVIIFHQGSLVITLNPDGMPQELSNRCWRIGGVGGGQEVGETIWECARREAIEETGTEIQLVDPPVTFFHDMDLNSIREVQIEDPIAPLLFQRITNPAPDTPYKPRLPTGPYIYYNLFLGKAVHPENMIPGDDVQALVFMPIDSWDLLHQGVTADQLLKLGVRIHSKPGFDSTRTLWMHPDESLDTVVSLIRKNPVLLSQLTV